MRLGILGGTFDPIHNGHLAMARAARRELELDRVLLVPSRTPPHKPGLTTPGDLRLAMVELAVRDEPGVEANDLELRREGVTYTVDTLQALRELYPDAKLFFIIGADSVSELPGWRNLPRILELAEIVTVPRPGESARFSAEAFPGIDAEKLTRCEANRLSTAALPWASSEIRRAVREGRRIPGALPEAVERFVSERGLYRTDASRDPEE